MAGISGRCGQAHIGRYRAGDGLFGRPNRVLWSASQSGVALRHAKTEGPFLLATQTAGAAFAWAVGRPTCARLFCSVSNCLLAYPPKRGGEMERHSTQTMGGRSALHYPTGVGLAASLEPFCNEASSTKKG